MNDSPLIERLRSSEMDYPLKITLITRGVSGEPCQEKRSFTGKIEYEGCKTPRRNYIQYPEDWDGENSDGTIWCSKRCENPMDIKVFSERQLELYRKFRSPENKRFDYLKHPENKEIFLKYFPEVVKEVIEVPA